MKDILGLAIADYFHGVRRRKLWVHTQSTAGSPERARDNSRLSASEGRTYPREEMPVKTYFRVIDEMPELEWVAMQHCRGGILDIGAGAGSHSLALQQLGQEVTALEISPLSADVIKARGVRQVRCQDFFGLDGKEKYDTLLLMMNGIGLAGTLEGLRAFLRKARALLRPGGTLVFDSSDISYLYEGTPPPAPGYFGELLYQYEYRRQLSDPFHWLFIDRHTLARILTAEGWQMELLFEDKQDQYLVKCH
jgi:SAM-dependent methyltransferase